MTSETSIPTSAQSLEGDDEAVLHTLMAGHQAYTDPHRMLTMVKWVKSDLEKYVHGKMGVVAKLAGLSADIVHKAITVCHYIINNLSGKPINDRDFEMETVMQILYKLPKDNKIGALLTKLFVRGLWSQLPHESASPPDGDGYQWRSADGSNNNTAYPDIGKSGTKYVQNCPPKRPQSAALPEPERIFDELLRRRPGEFRANESKISVNLFYMATLITHDLFNTNFKDQSINDTTSYLDLGPLYGWTKKMQMSVRTKENGLLKPDHFADNRLSLQPVGVTALVVLFSRNHNYLAEKLLQIDENHRFSSLKNKEERDEALFQTARLINERTYVNIILHDYLRVILGLNREKSTWTLNILDDFSDIHIVGDVASATGNQCSYEFNFLYRWHHAMSVEDEKWAEHQFNLMFGDRWKDMNMNTMFHKLGALRNEEPDRFSLQRNKDGRFDDKQLAKALIDGCKNVSGAFGGQNIPDVFRNIEIRGILHARSVNMCTLNEFREFLKLKKYQSFEEMNPRLAVQLAKLYKTVDDVELYPGLLTEAEKPAIGGSGLCANYTTSFAILSDAVALVRGDRFHARCATPFNLTHFGMEDSQPDLAVNYGTLLGPKLISRHLGSIYKAKNNIYAAFPFTIPSETLKNLGEDQKKYDTHEPL